MKIEYKEIHKKSGWHEKDILKSQKCGCFHCLEFFSPDKIADWVQEDPNCPRGAGKTALCPKCGIDSVLPDNINAELNIYLLKKMNKHFF